MLVELSGGDTAVFEYVVSGTQIDYTYVGYWESIQHHVVEASYWNGEGWNHFLIDHCTGARTIVKDVPVVSPDANRLVMASAYLDSDYAPTVLQIWRRAPDGGFELEWEHLPDAQDVGPAWGPTDPQWLDDRTVVFSAIGTTGEDLPGGRATLEAGEWVLVRDDE